MLTPQEVDDLFAVLRQMVDDGRGLVFISHKIREVLELSDRITVLRAGRKIGTVRPADVTPHELAEMMVGHELPSEEPPRRQAPARSGSPSRPHVRGDRGTRRCAGSASRCASGEIVGIAGVSGNGQRELAEAIAGLRRSTGGLDPDRRRRGRRHAAPAETRRAGLGYVPEERMRDGVVAGFTVAENLVLIDNAAPAYSRFGFLRSRVIRRHCDELVEEFDVKTPNLDTPAPTSRAATSRS